MDTATNQFFISMPPQPPFCSDGKTTIGFFDFVQRSKEQDERNRQGWKGMQEIELGLTTRLRGLVLATLHIHEVREGFWPMYPWLWYQRYWTKGSPRLYRWTSLYFVFSRTSRGCKGKWVPEGIELDRFPCVCGNPKTIDHFIDDTHGAHM